MQVPSWALKQRRMGGGVVHALPSVGLVVGSAQQPGPKHCLIENLWVDWLSAHQELLRGASCCQPLWQLQALRSCCVAASDEAALDG